MGGLLARLEPRAVVVAIGAVGAVLTAMGALYIAGMEVKGFDPNGETNFPSLFEAVLLWFSAVLAVALAESIRPRAALLTFAALFAFLGLDELLAIHERLQDRTGVSSEVLYAPLAAAAALLLFFVWRRFRDVPGVSALFAGGALTWAASQAIDGLQPHYQQHWSIVPEEVLELAGSTMFVLALLVALRAGVARGDAQVESVDAVVSSS